MTKSLGIDDHFHFLLPHERMRKIDVAAYAKFVRWEYGDSAITFHNLQRLPDAKVAAFAALPTNSSTLEHLHEWLGGTIQDRYLDGIDIQIDIVDAAGINRRKEMLGR